VLAAELAQRGIVGSREILEGRYGLFHNYVRTEQPDWDAIAGGLGERFPLLDVHGFKVWPACGYTRPTNAAVLELRNEYGVRPEEVQEIAIVGGMGATQLLSEPLEQKRRPQLAIDGKYSIPFTTAVMMLRGNVQLRDYTDAGLRDPQVLAMADRITYRRGADAAAARGGNSGVSRPTVEIRLRDGRLLSRTVKGVPGDPNHPVGWDTLEAKFRDCVSFAAVPLAAADIEQALARIADLEHVADVTEIVRLLTPRPKEGR
jgi:2-methylcitrate dehydratase PrpD